MVPAILSSPWLEFGAAFLQGPRLPAFGAFQKKRYADPANAFNISDIGAGMHRIEPGKGLAIDKFITIPTSFHVFFFAAFSYPARRAAAAFSATLIAIQFRHCLKDMFQGWVIRQWLEQGHDFRQTRNELLKISCLCKFEQSAR